MSKFDEIDHRIGRHDKAPSKTCPLCDPDLLPEPPPAVKTGLVDGAGPLPAFARWGDIWQVSQDRSKHPSENLRVFVQVGAPEWVSKRDTTHGGVWVNPGRFRGLDGTIRVPNAPEGVAPKRLLGLYTEGEQIEMCEGKWSERVENLATLQGLPGEAAFQDPLGVDLPQWAAEQNAARLTKKIIEEDWFPVSEVIHERSVGANQTTTIRSWVRAVKLPSTRDF